MVEIKDSGWKLRKWRRTWRAAVCWLIRILYRCTNHAASVVPGGATATVEVRPMDFQIAMLLGQDGITNGAIYALLALALVLVFAVTRVIFIPQVSSFTAR